MKVTSSLALLALSKISAQDNNSSNSVFDRLVTDVVNNAGSNDDTTDEDTNNASGRFISKNDMAMLQGYGCWCYFEEERGRGKPVDIFDESCKTLQDGYECIRRDAEEQNIECNVWDTEYNSAVGFGGLKDMTMGQLRDECDNSNGIDTCESWICRVEGWFTQNIIRHYFKNFQAPQDQYSHSRGGFNPDTMCIITPGPASEKSCCGEYPVRFPYKTQGGSRGCCINKTYNADVNNCCSDGSTKPVCDDPGRK